MSYDSVDDLHAVEDELGVFRSFVQTIAGMTKDGEERDDQPPFVMENDDAVETLCTLISTARGLVGSSTCRPTCGAQGEAFQDECDDETCGCPCGHVEAFEALPPRERRLREELVEHADSGHALGHDEGCAYGERFLLIEENVRGGYWLTTFDTIEEAAEYHASQEYAGEWTATEEIVDLDTGQRFEPGRRAQVWVPAPATVTL